MYLEGSDQHRGWFQSSILTAVGTTGRAPFETVLTHGFIVDEQGKKMAKSGGNAVSAVKATEQYGADVLRLYVASLDYADDIRMSERGIKEASEPIARSATPSATCWATWRTTRGSTSGRSLSARCTRSTAGFSAS
jgi:isoleucyl-tRNA synthetase